MNVRRLVDSDAKRESEWTPEAVLSNGRLNRLRIGQLPIAIDFSFMIWEDMMPAVFSEHSYSALGFTDDVKRPAELHGRTVHQFNAQIP